MDLPIGRTRSGRSSRERRIHLWKASSEASTSFVNVYYIILPRRFGTSGALSRSWKKRNRRRRTWNSLRSSSDSHGREFHVNSRMSSQLRLELHELSFPNPDLEPGTCRSTRRRIPVGILLVPHSFTRQVPPIPPTDDPGINRSDLANLAPWKRSSD